MKTLSSNDNGEARKARSSKGISWREILIGAIIGAVIGVIVNYPFSILASWQANQISKETTLASALEPFKSVSLWLRFVGFFFITLALVIVLYKYKKLKERKGELEASGLIDIAEKLEKSSWHPHECMQNIDTSLYFMGLGARKWTDRRDLFEAMLNRIKAKGGKVQFLVLAPSTLQDDKDAKSSSESLRVLKEFKSKYPLEIKIYYHRPHFRLMFMDSDILVVGHYRGFERDSNRYQNYQRGLSIDTPLHVYTKKPDWSFYYAFQELFIGEWEKAEDISLTFSN